MSDDLLERKALGQHGLVTTSQAADLGVDRWALSALVAAKQLVRLGRGVYALPAPELETPGGRHEAMARGALLTYPAAALSGITAVLAYGLPTVGELPTRPRLVADLPREVLTQSLILRPRRGECLVPTDWGQTVAVADAVVQVAREHGTGPGLVAADAALHSGVVTVEQLEKVAERVNGWPRYGRVRTMMAMLDGRSESPGETLLRLELTAAGIETTPQVEIRDPQGRLVGRVDLLVKGLKLVIEFDGLVKYRDGGAEALVAEKRREDELRALGYVVVRIVWADLHHPVQLLARVRAAMKLAAPAPAA